MTTADYGVTPEGFKTKRLIDNKEELEDYFIAEFGEINLEPQSVAGQIIGIYSKVLADIWENLQDVYLSQYPNSASGISLDNVAQLTGITRLPASRTSVIGVATGSEGTLIPAGSLARLINSQNVFFSTESIIISASNSVQNIVTVISSTSQVYTVLLNGVSYIYSQPIMNFSGPFVSGNVINVRVNGVNLPTVNYTTSSANTFSLLRSSLLTSPAIGAANIVGNTIEIFPNLGFQVVINSVNVSGVGAPSYIQTFNTPLTTATIAQFLAANIDTASNVNAFSSGSSFTITAEDVNRPYSLSVGVNLSITQTSTPVLFLAQEYGPIPAPSSSLTEILTPVAGWQSLDNFEAGIIGRTQETDEELRLRRARSLRIFGAATVEAIRSRILQEVPGVSSVFVFENVSLTQNPIEVDFSSSFNAANTISVLIDGITIGSVVWAGSQLDTMDNLSALIESYAEVKSVTVSGLSNELLTIEMENSQEISIEFNISGSGAPTYVLSGGRPPKSFEVVIEGGSNQDIGDKIWQVKPAGIQTYGNTQVTVVDSQGSSQLISFSRATPIYVWVAVSLTLNPQETFPTNGQQLVSNAILAYGNSLGIGVDVFIQRVQAVVFAVPGIASANVQLARTIEATDTPIYSAADIDIGETEVSVWDLSRITVSV